jgi:hypothetical protein
MSAVTAYKPVPTSTKVDNELESSHTPEQCSSLALVQPHTLDRSALDTLLLVITDVLMVLAWAGTLVYAALLWFVRDKFVDDITFSATKLIEAATT